MKQPNINIKAEDVAIDLSMTIWERTSSITMGTAMIYADIVADEVAKELANIIANNGVLVEKYHDWLLVKQEINNLYSEYKSNKDNENEIQK